MVLVLKVFINLVTYSIRMSSPVIIIFYWPFELAGPDCEPLADALVLVSPALVEDWLLS